ncbi:MULTISPECIES: helix-turn-helix domain-containing protein [unclassified Rhodococcus (in: high G+C Gram-positive bacteria)]|uniref:AraC-like ligand-binding domain-containing protein n=1 Tax=unclassified Rhodococcus (in: high G+C Gram-positive bacteria) TaxID=192944 RepID=UPI00163B5588|nr:MULTISPECIES: helix-turn-helix domain-containing protein [unclassified Rhodococcus (in: high G+C Gram-positive bacteria)]MBC2643015.1 helix-turn-helix domain-containing protein [Rhodococcus sp. 3A]MBC2892243.1 helix-turn-helix domain-containing protein [Rhodococcus sp. 4CII]
MSSLFHPGDQSLVSFDEFRESVSDAFVPLEMTSDNRDEFRGVVRGAAVGAVRITEIVAAPHVIRRTPRTIRASNPDYFKLGLQVRGRCVLTQDGREAALTPGDFSIYDTTRPYQLSFDDRFQMLVVMFPRNLLRVPSDGVAQLTASRVSGTHGLGALVTPLLRGLGEQIADASPAVAVHLGDAVLDLVGAAFAEQLHLVDGRAPTSRRDDLWVRVTAFIDDRLADRELDLHSIAAAHHISVRHLQKLFEAEGDTVSAWIRRRRLERCRRDLADDRYRDLPVSAIGARWGFVDAAHFSRLFKNTHGSAPGTYRAEAALLTG